MHIAQVSRKHQERFFGGCGEPPTAVKLPSQKRTKHKSVVIKLVCTTLYVVMRRTDMFVCVVAVRPFDLDKRVWITDSAEIRLDSIMGMWKEGVGVCTRAWLLCII